MRLHLISTGYLLNKDKQLTIGSNAKIFHFLSRHKKLMSEDYFGRIEFLHCMQKLEYLKQALLEGLMFTDHQVIAKPFIKIEDQLPSELVNELKFMIQKRLEELGTSLEKLPADNSDILFRMLGTMKGKVPMICFSEVPPGKEISKQSFVFGRYGVTVTREWLERQQGDRALYFGENSSFSIKLWRCLVTMHLGSLRLNHNGMAMFNMATVKLAINLFTHCEARSNFSESEWRIVGNTGFWGEKSQANERLSLSARDLNYVFVANDADIPEMQDIVEELASRDGSSRLPRIISFPETIPFGPEDAKLQ